MYLLLGISFVIILIMSTYVWLLKKQIREIKKQIEFITRNKTNMKTNVQVLASKEMKELAISINALMEEHRNLEITLQKTNKNFKETITNISHDLRTPLTSANGYLQLMMNPETTQEKKQEYLHIIEERINTVKDMLEQLFEYARIEAKEYTLAKERISLNTILEQTISEFYEDFVQRGIEPKLQLTDKLLYVIGDEKALKRVFQNVLGNAIIHGKGNIEIKLEEKQNKKIIQFSNKTDSIEELDVEKLFERFYTTDKSRTKKTTGLGMSIAKQFVNEMQGQIKAELKEDIFTITIWF